MLLFMLPAGSNAHDPARLDKQWPQIKREAARLEQASAEMCQGALAEIAAVGGDPAILDPNAVPEGLSGLQRHTQRIEVSLRTWEAAYKRLKRTRTRSSWSWS
ncbi:unnamed protein product [Peniophora sp. CBMAI 1063]|nr:unnamed protein product [Peniophora sp. CBMAI 1063]